jgi:hypothetical protein
MAEIKSIEQLEKEMEEQRSISQRWTNIRQDLIKLLDDIPDNTTLVIYMNTLEMLCEIMRERKGITDPKTVNL